MAEHPRDILDESRAALRCIRDLLAEADDCGKRDLHLVDPGDLCTVLRIITDRLDDVDEAMEHCRQVG